MRSVPRTLLGVRVYLGVGFGVLSMSLATIFVRLADILSKSIVVARDCLKGIWLRPGIVRSVW